MGGTSPSMRSAPERSLSLTLSFAVALSSAGPLVPQAAAQVVISNGQAVSAGPNGVAGVVATIQLQVPLGSPSLTNPASLGTSLPAVVGLTPAGLKTAALVRFEAAPVAPLAQSPAVGSFGQAVAAKVQRSGRPSFGLLKAVFAPLAPAKMDGDRKGETEGGADAAALAPPSRETLDDPGEARVWAESSFSTLKGETSGARSGDAVTPETRLLADLRPTGLIRSKTAAVTETGTNPATVRPAVEGGASPEAKQAGRPNGILRLLGKVLAFLYPFPEIYKTFKDGTLKPTPLWRAIVSTAGSILLGFVNAVIPGRLFWGVENIFGGFTTLAPVLISKILGHRPARPFVPLTKDAPWWRRTWHRLAYDQAFQRTLLSAGLILGMSYGTFIAAMAVLPPLLAASVAAAFAAKFLLGVQILAWGMSLFPSIMDLLRKLKAWLLKPFSRRGRTSPR